MASEEVKYCPFCGGYKLKIDSKTKSKCVHGRNIYYREYTISVRCNKCHSRGPTVSGVVFSKNTADTEYEENVKLIAQQSKRIVYKTVNELEQVAISKWNDRLFEIH